MLKRSSNLAVDELKKERVTRQSLVIDQDAFSPLRFSGLINYRGLFHFLWHFVLAAFSVRL